LSIDPSQWQAAELPNAGQLWGHQMMRNGKPFELPFPPPTERPLATPLQVYGKNFETGRHPTRLDQILKTEPLP
jgi:hypothetical protein